MKKNLITWILTMLLIGAAWSASAWAVEYLPESETILINPLYADVLNEENIAFRKGGLLQSASGTAESPEELTEMIRKKMVSRSEVFTLRYIDTEERENAFFENAFMAAFDHTGVPNEGDYLLWHYGAADVKKSGVCNEGVYTYTVKIYVLYYTTASEEYRVTQAVQEVLESLDIEGKSDYEKTCAIYGYICDHVTYDYEHYNEFMRRYGKDSTYEIYYTMFSAYGALIDGTSVCQGFGQLLYRMLLEEGIDCRLIPGNANKGNTNSNHAWNIVKVGNVYYDVDSTWDAGKMPEEYKYFLLTDEQFESGGVHERWENYTGENFNTAYPMGEGEPLKAYHSGACRIEGVALAKGGRIGIELSIGAEAYAGDDEAYAEVNGEKYLLKYGLTEEGPEGEVIRTFFIPAAPKELRDSIYIHVYDGEKEEITLYDEERKNVTEAGYRTTVYASIAKTAGTQEEAVAAALGYFGSNAQIYFEYGTAELPAYWAEMQVTEEVLACYAPEESGTLPEGLEYDGMSLIIDSTATMRLFFHQNRKTENTITFSIDSEPEEPEMKEDYLCIDISGIRTDELEATHMITVTDGANEWHIQCSPFSYAYKAIVEGDDEPLQNLMKAMYLWWTEEEGNEIF